MNIFHDSLAIGEKELKLALRFKVPFIINSLVSPLVRAVPFLIVYYGFFLEGSAGFGGVTEANFIVFIMLGIVTSSFFHSGYSTFSRIFLQEKFWHTIEALLLAPISKFSLIGGEAISTLVSLIPTLLLFMAISFIVIPASAFAIVLTLLLMAFVLVISLSIGLIVGTPMLFDENFSPLSAYMTLFIVFVSCFYYPIQVFENPLVYFIKPIVLLNPIYHAVLAARSVWIEGIILWDSFAYVLIASLVFPLIAVYLFNLIWKHLNIQGY